MNASAGFRNPGKAKLVAEGDEDNSQGKTRGIAMIPTLKAWTQIDGRIVARLQRADILLRVPGVSPQAIIFVAFSD